MSKIMLAYLTKRVEANQGIKISLLPGHLAQLPADVRSKYGANEPAIRKFMEKHPKVFVIDNTGRVFTRPQHDKVVRSTTDEACATSDEVTALYDVQGKVLRVFSAFGFISVTRPIKTTVYFTVKDFEDGKYSNLLTCGLAEGDCVVFDATKSVGHKAAFKATCVSRIDSHAVDSASESRLAKEQPRDEDDRLNEQRGVVHTVKPGYGFIVFGPKKKNCAFFHGSAVDKAVAKNSRNLTEFFTVGDKVYFDAKPDDKGTKWVKWKATRVWRAPTPVNSACNSEIDSGDEVFMSEDEEDIQGFLNDESEQDSSDVDIEDYPVGCPDWEDPPRRLSHQGDDPCEVKPLLEWPARKKLSGMKGFFVPHTDKTGLVFWLEKSVGVHVVLTTVYSMGKQIKSFSELCQDSSERGVEVFFDAVEADDMWVATLVWTGERPAKLHVNHSEHIFNSVLALVRVESFTYECSDTDVARPVSAPSEEEPSITIFPNGKGVVRKVLPGGAVCSVQDPDGDRQLHFARFYKDGSMHVEHLDKILQVGDAVSVDYMVGTSFGEEHVHCGLAWQGRKPSSAAQLSPEDFMKQISTRPAQRSATSAGSQDQPSCPSLPVVPPAKQENGQHLLSDMASLVQPLRDAPARGSTAPIQSGGHSLNGCAVKPKKKRGAVAARSAEPSISVYPNAKGTITQVLECFATVLLKEAGTVRKIEFSIDCFYRDGMIVMDDLNKVLGVGDEVFLDYMVGDTGQREVVHCDLVWQGKRPHNVCFISPDDFAKKLGIVQPSAGVVVSIDDLCSDWLQKSFHENNLAAPEQQQVVGEVQTDELEGNMSLPKQSSKQGTEDIKQSPMPEDESEGNMSLPKQSSKQATEDIKQSPMPEDESEGNMSLPKQSSKQATEDIKQSPMPEDESEGNMSLPKQSSKQATEDIKQSPMPEDESEGNISLPKQSSKQATEDIKQSPMPEESTGSLCHVAPSIDNETLLQLIRTVVEEYQAQLREELQKCMQAFMDRPKIIVGHDAETQTSREDTAVVLSSCGDQTPPFFSPCSSPSRELDPVQTSPLTADSGLLQPRVMKFGAFQPVEASSRPAAINTFLCPDSASGVPVTDCSSQLPALPESESILHSVKASETAITIFQPVATLDTQVGDVENPAFYCALKATELSHRPCTENEMLMSFEATNKDPTCAKVSQSEPAADDTFIVLAADSYVPANNSVLEVCVPLQTEDRCDSSNEHCLDRNTTQQSEALHKSDCEGTLFSSNGSFEAERTPDGPLIEKDMSGLSEEPEMVSADASVSQPVKSKSMLVEDGTCFQQPGALDAPGGGANLHLVEESGTVQADKSSSNLRTNGTTEPSEMVCAQGDAVFEAEGTSGKLLLENASLLSKATEKAGVDAGVLQPAELESLVVDSSIACSQPGAGTLDAVCGGTSTLLVEAPDAVGAGENASQSLDTAVAPESVTLNTADLMQDSQIQLAGNAVSGALDTVERPFDHGKALLACDAPDSAVAFGVAPSEAAETAELPADNMSP